MQYCALYVFTFELTEAVTICTHCQLKIAVNYYPNTDRMKTTVQYPPQVAPEGWPKI